MGIIALWEWVPCPYSRSLQAALPAQQKGHGPVARFHWAVYESRRLGNAYQGREIYGENRDFKSGKLGNQWRRDRARPRGSGRLRGDEMGDLLAILKEHSPVNSLVSDNCWKYADSTSRRLIRNFSAHSQSGEEKRT
ncbi:unnamed protein product [Sphagnum tenellum]